MYTFPTLQTVEFSPGPLSRVAPYAFHYLSFNVVTQTIDVATNSTQTTPTGCPFIHAGNLVSSPDPTLCERKGSGARLQILGLFLQMRNVQ